MSTRLTLAVTDAVATVTLVPPEGKPPTLDVDVIAATEELLAGLEARASSLTAVVIRSASPRFFCAGANIRALATIDHATIGPWVERGHRLMNRLEALPLPVIARVEGYAMGGGLELALACDLIFATPAARFAQSETKLGFVTGWGGSHRLVRRLGLARAKELVFSGRMFDATEAVRLGVADWCGEPADLDRHLADFLTAVAGNSRVAVREMKALLTACTHTRLEDNAALEADASRRCLAEGDAAARLAAFLAQRAKA